MKRFLLLCLLIPSFAYSQHFLSESDTTSILAKYKTKTFSIMSPFEGDDFFGHIWEVGREFETLKVVTVLQGSSSPTVDWTLRHGVERDDTGTELVVGGSTTNSTSAGNAISTASFDGEAVDSNEFIWIEILGTTGVVDAIHFTVYYKHTDIPE